MFCREVKCHFGGLQLFLIYFQLSLVLEQTKHNGSEKAFLLTMLLLPYFSHSSLFFSFIAAAFSIIHLLFLHQVWANNPLGVSRQIDKVTFHPYFTFKDIVGFVVILSILLILTLLAPYFLCDPDNFIPANPLVMPPHIQPQ